MKNHAYKFFCQLMALSLGLVILCPAIQAQQVDEKALIQSHRLKYTPSSANEPSAEVNNNKERIIISGEHINAELNAFIDSLTRQYYTVKTVPGYRILVYNGNEREQANAVKKKLYTLYEDADVYIKFSQPTFRVLVGDFDDKLMCMQFLQLVKVHFPQAVMLSDLVNIKR
jgi:hypothetical protein